MKKFLSIALSIIILSFSSNAVKAINDPLAVTNNKYGIHVLDENDLDDAQKLVNSGGGDWGYITVVITENDRDSGRWQRAFDRMRRAHLIPIIRIATRPNEDIWEEPQESEIDNWVSFLNSLNWVVKNRYVIISNEPNHAKEWGGTIDPAGYTNYLKSFSQKLKSASDDFFILQAGFDASANNSKATMNEAKFLSEMIKADPEIFTYIDGWTSHSYANPDFSGTAEATGKGTVNSYDWELNYLKSLGVTKEFSVFITETGWSNKDLGEEEIVKRFEYAFSKVWNDKRIVAVTPFILNYTAPPFDIFSWKNPDGSFYSFYDKVKEMPKIKGEPVQEVKGRIIGIFINPFTLVGSSFRGVVLAQNLGQSIWANPDIKVEDKSGNFEIITENFPETEPQRLQLIHISSLTLNNAGNYQSNLVLRFRGKDISDSKDVEILILEPTELKSPSFFGKILGFLKSLF